MTLEPSLSLTDIVRNTPETGDLLSNIFKKIRSITEPEEIFQASVEIVHQVLKCDRAVVYSLQQDSFCKIVAEAVTPGYTQTLGSVIKDSCFESRYIDKYQKGRVRAISNIYKADMSPCYIENLEKIEVKANLVVPLVLADRSLYGLLVMHQCSQARKWRQSEINFVLQIADWMMGQIHHQTERQALEAKLATATKWQNLLDQATIVIHASVGVTEVLQTTVDRAKEILECDRVVIYGLSTNSIGEIVAESTIPALAPILGNVIKDPCFEYRYIDKYEQGRTRAIDNIYEAGMTACYVENLDKIAVKSNLVVPINWDNGKIYGLLVAHQCFQFRKWQSEEIQWLKQVGIQAGLSLSKAKLKEQIVSINSNFNSLENARDAITIAKSQYQQTQQPIQQAFPILLEINNLNKLLNREINTISQNGSLQTKKEIKLISIIIKKLFLNTSKLKKALDLFNIKNSKIGDLLETAAISLYTNESESSDLLKIESTD